MLILTTAPCIMGSSRRPKRISSQASEIKKWPYLAALPRFQFCGNINSTTNSFLTNRVVWADFLEVIDKWIHELWWKFLNRPNYVCVADSAYRFCHKALHSPHPALDPRFPPNPAYYLPNVHPLFYQNPTHCLVQRLVAKRPQDLDSPNPNTALRSRNLS